MRRMFLLLIFCPLLLGAAIKPTESFYLNDYNALLSEEEREEVTGIATDLFGKTGSRLVFLSAADLAGAEPADYANSVIQGWGFNASDALYMVYPDPEKRGGLMLMIGENVGDKWEGTVREAYTNKLMDPYRALAGTLYEKHGAEPDPEIAPLLEVKKDPFNAGTAIIIAVLGVAVARAFRADRKLKGKYLKGHVRRRKSYLRTYNEEDEYNNEKIYKITYDDQD